VSDRGSGLLRDLEQYGCFVLGERRKVGASHGEGAQNLATGAQRQHDARPRALDAKRAVLREPGIGRQVRDRQRL
jgi:hypothetical protein